MMWLACLTLWWIVCLKMPTSSWSRASKLLVSVCTAVAFLITVRQYVYHWYPQKYLRDTTILHVGPDESYGICGSVRQHEVVTVYEDLGEWSKVGYMRLRGWLKSEALVSSKVQPS